MSSLNIIVIDDQVDLSNAIKTALESKMPGCSVKVLNPSRDQSPTFDAFFAEIEDAANEDDTLTVVLLDNQLGRWKWSGANLAPSLQNVISISTELVPWAKICFRKKHWIFQNDPAAIEELVAAVTETMKTATPSDW